MLFAGGLFAITHNFLLLLIAATIGVISPSGYEVGPFLSIEQAVLSQIIPNERRTNVFAWYNLVGSFATALGGHWPEEHWCKPFRAPAPHLLEVIVRL